MSVLFACGADDLRAAEALRDDVVLRYGESHRRYHTVAHALAVADGVTTLSAAAGLTDSRAARLAAWLHDVVYDPRRNDNEDASAEYSTTRLSALGVDPGLVRRCGQLIRSTATHESSELDEAVLCDADLAVLAAEPERYRSYARQVREEYGWVTDDDFRAGRSEILRTLLDREVLYRTPYAARWEAAARANIAAEIRELN